MIRQLAYLVALPVGSGDHYLKMCDVFCGGPRDHTAAQSMRRSIADH